MIHDDLRHHESYLLLGIALAGSSRVGLRQDSRSGTISQLELTPVLYRAIIPHLT